MSFVEDSHAKTSPQRTLTGWVWTERDLGCGLSLPESFASYDRDTSSWRTSQYSLLEGLTEFLEPWPKSGTMRSGFVYQLPPLVRRTSDGECSLLPTPTAERYGSNHGGKAGRVGRVRHNLQAMARQNLWPTPVAKDAQGARNATSVRQPGSKHNDGRTLTDAVILSGDATLEETEKGNRVVGGALNPRWVEWLMGFPVGWTALER